VKATFAKKHESDAKSQSDASAQGAARGAREADRGGAAGMPLFLQPQLSAGAGLLQPKLSVSRPDDPYEREAEQVAAQVVASGRSAAAPLISAAPIQAGRMVQRCAACAAGKPCARCQAEQLLQRQASDPDQLAEPALPAAALQSLGAGQPLDPTARAMMEARFGQSFADVQIHADSGSAAVAQQLHAHAFTVGQHIYFGSARYEPQSASGQRLLAHELTHTVQQRGGSVAPMPARRSADGAARAAAPTRSQRGPLAISAQPSATIQRYSLGEFASDLGDAAGTVYDAGASAAGAVYDTGAAVVGAGLELAGDALELLVEQVAPELAELIDKGPFEYFKGYVVGMIEDWLPSFLSDISPGEIIDSFISGLSEAFALVEGILQGDAASCQAFADILGAIRELASSLIDNPVVQALKDLFSAVSDTISTVAKLVLAPAFDLLRDILGGAWDAIKSVATTVWGWISTVRDYAGEALDWVLEQLGLSGGGGSEGGIFDWIKEQASAIWDSIKETFAPVIGPIQTVLGVMFALSPLGQVYLLIKYAPKVVEAVQWLWAHRDDPNIIRSAHEQMGNTILPTLLETFAGFRDMLQGAANWLLEMLSSLATGVLELLGGISGVPLLSLAEDFIQTLADGVNSLLAWGQNALQSIVTTIQEVGQSIWSFVEPYKNVLTSIALAIANPPMIPVILAGWAWGLLPDCIKAPIIDFFLDILIWAIDALPELMIFGPLWPILKSGILGFFRRMREQSPEVKERISNKIAKIMSGQSLDFLIGFVKGFLQGLWEGITDPFMMIWMVIEGLNYAQGYLERLAAETLGVGSAPAPATAAAAPTAAVSAATVSASPASAAPETARGTAPAGALGAAADVDPALGTRVGEMAQELEPPVTSVTENFWSAVSDYFNSSEGMTFDSLVTKLGEAWDSLRGKVEEAGGQLADKAVEFLAGDGAEGEMGSAVGWLAGTIAFEVLLDVITAGIWAATGPVAKAIQKFMTKAKEVIEEVFALFRKLGSYLIDGVKKLGKMVSEAAGGAFKLVKDALGEIGEKLVRYADEIISRFGGGAGRRTEQKLAAEAEQKLAREAEQKLATEAEQKLATNAEQKLATEGEQKAAKEGEQKAATEAEQKAAEMPAAMAQARAIEASMDADDLPVPVLIGALDSIVKSRYKWIERFEAEPQGGRYLIYMIASKTLVGDYTPGTEPAKTGESKQPDEPAAADPNAAQTQKPGKKPAERAQIQSQADIDNLRANPPSKPSNLTPEEEARWERYLDYRRQRLDAIEAELKANPHALPDIDPPRTWDSYNEFRSPLERGPSYQGDFAKDLRTQNPDVVVGENVGVSKRGGGTTKYPDQFEYNPVTGEAKTYSNKSRDFANLKDVEGTVEGDVREALTQYGGTIEVRRPGPLAEGSSVNLFEKKVRVSEVTLVYDSRLAPAEARALIVATAQAKAAEIYKTIKLRVIFWP
jgi:hypothetical protein